MKFYCEILYSVRGILMAHDISFRIERKKRDVVNGSTLYLPECRDLSWSVLEGFMKRMLFHAKNAPANADVILD